MIAAPLWLKATVMTGAVLLAIGAAVLVTQGPQYRTPPVCVTPTFPGQVCEQ